MFEDVAVKFESRNLGSGGLPTERILELCTVQHWKMLLWMIGGIFLFDGQQKTIIYAS